MAETIPINYPNLNFDFDHEARVAAMNEACAYRGPDAVECSPVKLCDECEALAVSIKARLVRAFIAGQASMVPRQEVTLTDGEG